MQEDGNFVVYDEAKKPRFSTGTAGHPGAFLRLQNDGNLVVYAPTGRPSGPRRLMRGRPNGRAGSTT